MPGLLLPPSRPVLPAIAPEGDVETGLQELLARVEEAPLDANSCFELAVGLLRHGDTEDGIRYLDRSIRLEPALVLWFLIAPEYEDVRQESEVRRLLWAVKRDEDRRAWSGYV